MRQSVKTLLVVLGGGLLVVSGNAIAAPSRALTQFVAQAAASSVSPTAGTTATGSVAQSSETTEVVTQPTNLAPVAPSVVQLPITVRPPFRPIIRSPFTP